MHNFFVNNNQITGNIVSITSKDARHIYSVLRMKKGEKIYISNKDTAEKYLSEIENISKEIIQCTILEKVETTEPLTEVTLFQGLPKADKMEYIIQKSVELGVHEIVPVEMKNCVVKLKDPDKKILRWQAISESAAKQSKRNIIPKVTGVLSIKNLLEQLKNFDLVIVAYENEEKTTLKQVLKETRGNNKIAIIVGPEGGIDKNELDMLVNYGAKAVTLGKRILRTETASIAILSMMIYEFEL